MEKELLRKILENTDKALENDAKQNAEIKHMFETIKKHDDDIDLLKAFKSKSKGAWFTIIGAGTLLATVKAAMAFGIL